MDKPSNPTGANDFDTLLQQTSPPADDLGATGIFTQPSQPAARPPAEPVVHQMVMGGAPSGDAPDMLERLRQAAAAREMTAEKEKPPLPKSTAPSVAVDASGNLGFTQLLQTLQGDSGAAPSPPVRAGGVEAQPVSSNAGFTSLLQTMNPVAPAPAASPTPSWTAPPAPPAAAAPPPAAKEPGEFTKLFSTLERPIAPPPAAAAPAGSWTLPPSPPAPPAAVAPPPAAKEPGEFTKLFSSLDSPHPQPSAAVPSVSWTTPPASASPTTSGESTPAGSFTRMLSMEPSAPSAPPPGPSNAGSFTRMLAMEPPTTAPRPDLAPESRAAAESLGYNRVPDAPAPSGFGSPVPHSGGTRDPFAPAPIAEAAPVNPAPVGGGGITSLIRMLDEPAAPPARAPEYSSAPGFSAPAGVNRSGYTAPPPQAPPSAPAGAAGPSEFTRILDASRLREMGMQGGPAAAPAPPPAAASSAPSMPISGFQGPSISASPTLPSSPSVPSYGGMPSGGGFTPMPPQMPGAQVSYTPPSMSMPSAPAMATPQPPPPAAQPPSKMQQMIPLLLILIAFLLLGLIVVVVFLILMKH